MRASSTSRSAVAALTAVLAVATLGMARTATASPQSGTSPGIGVWLQPGRGAQLARNGNLAVALVRARDAGNRLEWSGRSPAPLTTAHRPAARTSDAPAPRPTVPANAPDSAANGSSGSRARLIEGRGNDYRQHKRLPDAWSSLDPSQDRRSSRGGAGTGAPAIRLTGGEAVFHDAHAPPARGQSLDSRLS